MILSSTIFNPGSRAINPWIRFMIETALKRICM